jgi:hypothetical protein
MDDAPRPPLPPGQDQGKNALLLLGVTVAIGALLAGVASTLGVPTETQQPLFILFASLQGLAFCTGQGAMVTGFMAMKQRKSPLWLLVAIIGALAGIAAFVSIFALSISIALQQGRSGRPF